MKAEPAAGDKPVSAVRSIARACLQGMHSAALACILTAVATTVAASVTAAVSAETASVPRDLLLTALQCPCAYFERGGFWDSDVAQSVGVVDRVYREKRCSCAYEPNCDKRWLATDKSLSMTWLGTNGINDSEIQLQFCSPVYLPGTPTCQAADHTFTLRQVGWWMDLLAVHCRCPDAAQQPSIRSFRYIDPLPVGEPLRRQIVHFACSKMPECATSSQPCYQEDLSSTGQLKTGGRVLCVCPVGSFCPIYKPAMGPRRPVYTGGSTVASSNELTCQPEP